MPAALQVSEAHGWSGGTAQLLALSAGLRDKGYAPYIVEAAVAGKGTWFRVRMGRFASKDAASRYMEDFRRETAMNAIVTTAN